MNRLLFGIYLFFSLALGALPAVLGIIFFDSSFYFLASILAASASLDLSKRVIPINWSFDAMDYFPMRLLVFARKGLFFA